MGISAKPLPHSYPNRQQGHWDSYIPDSISYCLRAVFWVCVYRFLDISVLLCKQAEQPSEETQRERETETEREREREREIHPGKKM